jgi:N12 class adenine-specific DNA methylase
MTEEKGEKLQVFLIGICKLLVDKEKVFKKDLLFARESGVIRNDQQGEQGANS